MQRQTGSHIQPVLRQEQPARLKLSALAQEEAVREGVYTAQWMQRHDVLKINPQCFGELAHLCCRRSPHPDA